MKQRAVSWNAIRICTGFGHEYPSPESFSVLLREECWFNQSKFPRPITMLCTFDSARLHPEALKTCLQLHPWMTDGKTLIKNDTYAPIEDPLQDVVKRLLYSGALKPPFATLDFLGDTPVICVGDEMDMATAPEVGNAAQRLIELGHRRLVIELSNTTFIDAEAIHAILQAAIAMEKKGGRLVISDSLEPTRKIFQLIRLGERIPIYLTPEDAEYAASATNP